VGRRQAAQARTRDIEIIDSKLRLVVTLRRAARERGGPLPSAAVADARLDERTRVNWSSWTDQRGLGRSIRRETSA